MKKQLIFCVGVLLYLFQSCSYLPEEVAIVNGLDVEETANYIRLKPSNSALSKTGLLFYPGGLVDPHAYIPTLQGLALEGYPIVIVKVSANLAIMNANKAEACKKAFPEVEQWVLGGHSLGGAVACIDIYANPSKYVGALLMAAYTDKRASLSGWDGAVLSLFGEQDGLASPDIIDEYKDLLPTGRMIERLMDMPSSPTEGQTLYHQIDGGNHAQFGSYGEQAGDGKASITRAEQHTEIENYIRAFFNANNW